MCEKFDLSLVYMYIKNITNWYMNERVYMQAIDEKLYGFKQRTQSEWRKTCIIRACMGQRNHPTCVGCIRDAHLGDPINIQFN